MTPVTMAEIDEARDACLYALEQVREQHAAGRDTRLEREILNDRRVVVERLLARWWAQGCREPDAVSPTCDGSGNAPMSLRAPKTQDEVIALCRQGAQWCHLCRDFGCTDNTHPERPPRSAT